MHITEIFCWKIGGGCDGEILVSCAIPPFVFGFVSLLLLFPFYVILSVSFAKLLASLDISGPKARNSRDLGPGHCVLPSSSFFFFASVVRSAETKILRDLSAYAFVTCVSQAARSSSSSSSSSSWPTHA